LKQLIQCILITSLITLSACKTNPVKSDNSTGTIPSSDKARIETPELQDFDIEKDTLYDLLVAEVAAQRSQFTITLINYIQQARMTLDPGVIKRAINAAQLLKDMDAIREMALLWAEVEPDSVPAHQLLAFQYSLQKNYVDAMLHIEAILQLDGEARVDSLAASSAPLNDEEKNTLLRLYNDLYQVFPSNYEVGYSLALVQKNLTLFEPAISTLKPILEEHPDFEPAAILYANLLYDIGQLDEAIDYADEKFDDFPKNYNLGRLYASMLIETKQLDRAEYVFQSLIDNYPLAHSFKLSHALVMLENQKIDEAKVEFLALLTTGAHLNEANFYLGRIADSKENNEEAIQYYTQVGKSIHYELALERSSFLLGKLDRIEEMLNHLSQARNESNDIALKIWLLEFKLLNTFDKDDLSYISLNQALVAFPDDEQLLYARAMIKESNLDLVGMEEDLRHIINNNPKHAIALNALGYTLADQTDRTTEALKLIEQAIEISPDNPAILDSLGWALFKLDKKPDALVYLFKAFQGYQDGEVAAHLGEVLWSLDQHDKAIDIWAVILTKNPGHEVLLETIQRLHPELLERLKNNTETATNPQVNDSDNKETEDQTATKESE